ncbi:PREDICTED: 4-coumarate--CoA ligase 2-like [Papilio xuthus]|uniref:4-coumarate--CoA ligase 2-like n=1 Tax=Papilio xuthus TaxID=66420 RepID=A0AAJ7EDD8_PAPXU|nr:PREDICTED: 4-coumarate--CoA ligase 2-like [Papilio xuthus]
MARKILLRQFKQLRTLRRFTTSVNLKNQEQYVIKSPLEDIVIPNMRFLDRLWLESPSFINHVAIECAESKKSYTYQQLQKNMAVFATSLRKKLGLNPGDVVAAMLPNCPQFPVVAFGALQAGCVVTPINPIYKELEVTHQVSTTAPKVFVTIPQCYETVVKGLQNAKIDAKIVVIDNPSAPIPEGAIRYSEISESGEADYSLLDKVEKNNDDVAFIPFSSGTTGLPKGVEITYGNLIAAIEIMQNKRNSFPLLTQGDFQDVVPCILPFFHIYGLVVALMGHLAKGCKLISLPKFSAGLYLDVLDKQKPTLLYVVPPIAILLGKHPDVKVEHFERVRNVICGAAPLADSDVHAILEKCKRKLEFNQGFGATETTSLATTTLMDSTILDYSACGVPMASVLLKFVDPLTGNPVPIGEPGELYVKSPTIMKGYHKNEKATKETLTEDGYFKTGDLGYYKPEAGLYITDRIKELIKVKGMQVAPAELESILRSHPAVQDAAVIGIPHEIYGEVPKAFVIRKNGKETSAEELQSFVADRVAVFKKIEEVAFVNDIPKTTTGKILRKDLKKMYA